MDTKSVIVRERVYFCVANIQYTLEYIREVELICEIIFARSLGAQIQSFFCNK